MLVVVAKVQQALLPQLGVGKIKAGEMYAEVFNATRKRLVCNRAVERTAIPGDFGFYMAVNTDILSVVMNLGLAIHGASFVWSSRPSDTVIIYITTGLACDTICSDAARVTLTTIKLQEKGCENGIVS